jgi:hypothetical protein
MGYIIITPASSFVRFDGENTIEHCIHGTFTACLPVYGEDDIAFQFVVQADTVEEADLLCLPTESGIRIGIIKDCDNEAYDFDAEFTSAPERFRISSLQVLYNWPHGMEGMIGAIQPEECFHVRVIIDNVNYCTNCFQRVPDDCFTSVIEYGNDENFGGFNYCNSGAIPSGESTTCDPTVITFTNQSSIVIPYTTSLQDKYGTVPTVQVWIYIDGVLTNAGVVATFDAMPPTLITVDPGGVSSGIIVIR